MLTASRSLAQSDGPRPPPLPSGDGVVVGSVVRAGDAATGLAGVPVVLYGLSQTGEPGVGDTLTDADGRFRFEGVSSEPGMAYLVGAKYAGIPFFGPSIRFADGARELEAIVEVTEPTADASGLAVDEVVVQIEWTGGKLAVQELHRLTSRAGRVVLVAAENRGARTPAPFETALPPGATDFLPLVAGFEDALERSGDRVRFWGPIYPNGQDVRFQYLVPIEAERTRLELALPMGAARLRVLSSLSGPKLEGEAPLATADDEEIEGRRFRVLAGEGIERDARVALVISLPETDADVERLTLPRADVWLELDDTQLVATTNVELAVDGANALASEGREPLARFALPPDAQDVEVAAESRALGARIEDGAIALRGPLPAGSSTLRAHYRVPATPDGARIALAFPREIATLNVLVADTGVEIESARLHRRRPFRQGTRTYLHREAFQVEAGESLELGLAPIRRGGLARAPAAALALLGVAAAAWYLLTPLRGARASREDESTTSLAAQREAIYQDVRDLDHDFETGKLDAADHRTLRAALLARAAASIERERAGGAGDATTDDRAPRPSIGRFCPSCGERIDASWTFCSHCGAKLGGGESRA